MLDGELPPGFERRVMVLRPGERHRYRPCEWRDAIVSVDSGEILLERGALEREAPAPLCFRGGDLLSLGGLDLIAIYNPGPAPAVLIAVRRSPQPNRQEPT
jgi:hypothetical protein